MLTRAAEARIDDPKISISVVQLPSFSIQNSTVNFTFAKYISIRNPKRAAFSHYDNIVQLLYSGSESDRSGSDPVHGPQLRCLVVLVFDANRASRIVQNPMGLTFGG
ncbi:hypothetical protein DVH24_012419 [Malus domestica]|uniref:Late embryogenesis abundant protein LEA-2 subgroup domain-containing protein n=1 Tax=Malus domestica TaxID=3750 RepID=A0A498HT43_MALDO|nr:hypothetical protein DVH24_012419 [Malus domestica]